MRLARVPAATLVGILACICAGCQPGIQWRAFHYDPDASQRDAGSALRMVYFRHWAVVACTQFENNVLMAPEVLQATRPLYCVVLDYRVDQALATQWGVQEPPGLALLSPQGALLASDSGSMDKARVLELIRKAQNSRDATPAQGPNTQPTTSSAPTKP